MTTTEMSEQKPYSRAPITEAIIDLRISERPDFGIDQLKKLLEIEKDNYPKKELVNRALGKMEIDPKGSATASARQEQIGYKFTSRDSKYVWQAHIDGCTISRLAPYENWEVFSCEAKRLWAIYRKTAEPVKVVRVAVRYINRIDLPQGNIELKDYFRTSPEVSPGVSQSLSGFFMQLQFRQEDLKSHLLINQTAIPPGKENATSIILDIDLFRSDDIPSSEDEIWQVFEKLRLRKDEVFEASITEKTRELIR